MTPERIHTSTPQPETVSELNRFVRLIGYMDKYAEGEGPLRQLPQVELKMKDNKPIPTRFLIYSPKFSVYSPSIIMETGQEVRDSVTGRQISGGIERTYVRKSYLKKSGPYYSRQHEQAEADLRIIEEMFYAYKNTIENSQPNGQNQS